MNRRHTRFRIVLSTALLTAALARPALAQRELKNIPPPDPELERQTFQVAEGFEVNLYAADPAIAKPIQMNFDAAGRLWIASSEIYPHILPGQKSIDRVVVVQDDDGDGRADRTSVFAEGLLIPTGVEPGDGGVYVANSTELLHFTDTDGDGRADRRRVVLSGFGTEDTHHILHTLRWGHDGMLYMNQSIYIHSHIETPYGVRRLNGGGTWQFRPETMQLEVFTRGLCNPWGHHFDRYGQSFATDGAGGEGINYYVPGAYYFTSPDAVRIIHGLNPGSPKHCGLEIVGGRHLPDDWQGSAVTNDFRANRVVRFAISEDGSGFASRQQPDVIRSTHVGFRPVDVKMGPDGAIYIADWYNPIIQHGEVDFRDPRRDHTHGRIWRITATGRPVLPRPRLVGAGTEELFEQLKSPEGWTRQFAKRVLKERGAAAVAPALAEWTAGLSSGDPQFDQHRLEALWMHQALEVVAPELLTSLLHCSDGRLRAAAVRVAKHWQSRMPGALEILTAAVADPHPRVRLEAVRALAAQGSVRAAEVALRALDHPQDRFLEYALWLAARELAPVWLAALDEGTLDFGGRADHLLFALEAVDSPRVVAPLVRWMNQGRIPEDQQQRALVLIARTGGPGELEHVFRQVVLNEAVPAASRAQLLQTLAEGSKQRSVVPAGDLTGLGALVASSDPALAGAAALAAGVWKAPAASEALLARAQDAATPTPLRRAVVDALAVIGGEANVAACMALTQSDQPADTRQMAVEAVAKADLGRGAPAAVELLADGSFSRDPAPVFAAVLLHKEGPAVLAKALTDKKLPADVAKLGLRTARSMGRQDQILIDALNVAGGLAGGPVALSTEELSQLVTAVQSQGDAARGEALFRRGDLACQKCHAIAGAGGQVGPDLISIGATAQVDYLVESILLPNKAVKENYHAQTVATLDGRVINGVVVRQTDRQLVLRNGDDQEVAVALDQIEERAQAASLMPSGLVDSITRPELIDLVRFLSELGKVGPFSVGPARVVRRWQALAATPENVKLMQRVGTDGIVRRASTPIVGDKMEGWSPAYSTVAGGLPLGELPALKPSQGQNAVALVRCQMDVSGAGKVALNLKSTDGLSLWIDGRTLDLAAQPPDQIAFDLAAGVHTLTLAVDLAVRQGELHCELVDAAESPATAQWLAGK